MLKREEEKKAQELVELGNTYLKDGAYQKAKDSFVKAKSIYESQPGYNREVAQINRKIGDVSKAQGAAMRRMSSNFSSINTVSERMSKPSTSRSPAYDGLVDEERAASAKKRKSSFGASVGKPFPTPSGAQLSSNFPTDTASGSISKSGQSSSFAHNGSVDNDVFLDLVSSDSSQESRRVSNIGSARDVSMGSNTVLTLMKNKNYYVDPREVKKEFAEMLQRLAKKSQSQSKSQLSEKTDNKPEAYSSDSINDLANEKVTKASLNPESSLGNTSTGTGLDTSVSIPKLKKGNTFIISFPNPNVSEKDQVTNSTELSSASGRAEQEQNCGSQSDCNSPSTDMDSVQQPKCDISLSREGGK